MRSVVLFTAALTLLGCMQTVHPRVGTGVPPPDWVEVEHTAPIEDTQAAAPESETGPTEVAARHILISYRGAAHSAPTIVRSKPEALARAQEVLTRLRAGEDFAALAVEYTEEPGGADRQGDLGRFTRDKMVKRFADAAFALEPGQYSDPVETQFGFHIIQRTE
jgi:peptidyl-prolyl cis-trans isomerase NIMA-interacting 1